jgi:hypothetical protein
MQPKKYLFLFVLILGLTYLYINNQAVGNGIKSGNTKPEIHVAVEANDFDAVEACLAKKCDINKPYKLGNTPLIQAIWQANVKMIAFLLEHGADPDIPNKHGAPIFTAVLKSDKETADEIVAIIDLLHKHHASFNVRNPEGKSFPVVYFYQMCYGIASDAYQKDTVFRIKNLILDSDFVPNDQDRQEAQYILHLLQNTKEKDRLAECTQIIDEVIFNRKKSSDRREQ